ncbi:hypothetical protein OAS41_02570 [Candidatus Marinimicrobia bacterium]|jgi:hypothetical protein|nr:hypothetical protein [Candidatus Neomarinimicrobiota bacterium]MDA7685783.1 hypothetical protein [Candidatus Neomarinimicrobiota bacterium]MDB3883380.1 hypothetical protein [Candidatus Neomarinimicrobiota bacterium]MDB3980230.1 hypothetical protein [Candidatus Neomarinimicrobiota bacterium]MDC0878479.1 hypothetical protein [Candidatus Neomarinimicrobiota bacterium]|tara:strand:- start:23460 stop:24077 length:618 start_codon:yes stop_codon:yes gene_type:complete
MKNNLTISILLLFFFSFTFGQEITINNLEIDSRQNGTLINISSTKKIDLENVTAWYSSEWFYLTIYNAKTDSTKVSNQKLDKAITKIEIANNEESTQIALKLRKEIESFEITNPTRKNISFLLRLSQEEAKKSIEMDDNIEQFSDNDNEFDGTKTTKQSKKSNSGNRSDRAVELSLLGAIVAMSDIANPTTFLFGAIIALSTMFF